jgi:deazaflavin-dependent oxidoreductase (nitroreductase family)
MPIPKVVGQWNKAGLNRLTRHIAPWMPGFGVIVHRGRRSGARYQTPVNVFRAGNGYVIALTYGPDTDWVKRSWPQAAANSAPAARPSSWAHRACFTTKAAAASVPPSGRCCGS